MAFRPGPGIDPNGTSVPVPPGTVDRRGILSPAVPKQGSGTTTPAGPLKPVLGPEAGLFGGTLPPSRTGTEKRAQRLGDKQRFETFHPREVTRGPFVLAEQGVGATPIRILPPHAAAVFADMATGRLR
jgi:hypothetical protein